MALLADLRHLQENIADRKARADRQRAEIASLYDKILAKCAVLDLYALLPERFDLLRTKETDLSVPFSSMRIAFDPVIFCKGSLRDPVFLCALLVTYANCTNNRHRSFLLSSSDPGHSVFFRDQLRPVKRVRLRFI